MVYLVTYALIGVVLCSIGRWRHDEDMAHPLTSLVVWPFLLLYIFLRWWMSPFDTYKGER